MLNFKTKLLKPCNLLIILMFCVNISGIDVLACNPEHTGKNMGTGTTDSIPSNKNTGNSNKNCEKGDCDVDPVFYFTGEWYKTEQDLFIPSRGMPVEISRTYKNQKTYNGRCGYGWFFNYNWQLKRLVNGNVEIMKGDGNKDEYIYSETENKYFGPAGQYTELVRNTDGTFTLTNKHKKKWQFNENGSLTTIEDRNGNNITFTYTTNKQPISGVSKYFINKTNAIIAYDYKLEKITDTVGREITFAYNTKGRIETITDFDGRQITYTYDINDDLISVEDPEHNIVEYTYDSDHNLLTIEDGKNNIFLTNTYNIDNQLQTQTYGTGTTTLAYDSSERETTVTDREGNVEILRFDEQGNMLERERFTRGIRPSDPTSYLTKKEYNADKELSKIVYPEGNAITYVHDNKGNTLQIINKPKPESTEPDITTTFTYEPNYNFVKTITDPKNNITTYYYDYEEASLGDLNNDGITDQDKGNLVKIVYPTADTQTPTTLFTYNQYGQVETTTNPAGVVTKYQYYATTGYLEKVTNDFGGENIETNFTYDNRGNVLTVTDAKSNTTTFEYDNLNQLTKTIAPAPYNYQTKYTYDANGNLERLERQKNPAATSWQVTEYSYDTLDQLTQITRVTEGPSNEVTTFKYDANGNRTKIIDANLKETNYTYDERDLLYTVTDAENNTTTYNYTNNGKLEEIVDANSNTTTYQYTDFDQLFKTIYPDSSYEEYAYDLNNNLTSKRTRKGDTITYDYDNLNRLIVRAIHELPLQISYTYDINSRLKRVTELPSQRVIEYAYNNLNQVTNVDTYGKTIAYEYDNNGNRTKLTYPDTTYITYEYDHLNRLDKIKDQNQTVIADYQYDQLSRRTQIDLANSTQTTYTYNDVNQLIDLVNKINGGSNISSWNHEYDNVGNKTKITKNGTEEFIPTYDDIYQLTGIDYPTSSPYQDTTFDYDSLGNRDEVTVGTTTEDWESNALNQISSIDAVIPTYDTNGNLTNDGDNIYEYDFENRLVKATTSSNIIEYSYDSFGRRIQKDVKQLDETLIATTTMLYDGDMLISEYDGQGTLTKKYINSNRIDEIILMEYVLSGEKYYYHRNGLNSTTEITDNAGNIIEKYKYGVYGSVFITDANNQPLSQSQIGNAYLFTGRFFDFYTGNYYYRAREYSPKLGRFMQVDSLGYKDSMNLQQYTLNNPINYVDPYGTTTAVLGATAILIIATAVLSATVDWQKAGAAMNDISTYVTTTISAHYSRPKPTPSGNWPPTPEDLGVGDPGTSPNWPKMKPGWKPPGWWWGPAIATLLAIITEPKEEAEQRQKDEDILNQRLLDKLRREEMKRLKSNGGKCPKKEHIESYHWNRI